MEFGELNVEYGYSYESAAVVPDGTPTPKPIDDIRVYQPFTRPGAPLPHAWLYDQHGNRGAIKDLVTPGRFLLIAGEDGEAWCEAAKQLAAEANLPLDDCGSATSTATSRPALGLDPSPPDHNRRRDPRAAGPLNRLATCDRVRGPTGSASRCAQPAPRSADRGSDRVAGMTAAMNMAALALHDHPERVTTAHPVVSETHGNLS